MRDGKELTRCAASRNSTNPIALLEDIESDNPSGDIFIITDNLSSHNSAQTRAWMAGIRACITSSFLRGRAGSTGPRRLVGVCGRLFRRDALVGQSFANSREIEQATRITTAQLNHRAKPWVWGRPPKDHRHYRRLFSYRI
ncbi:MAG TPA: IS630 family transposase [Ktedonobacteraceae bacterium]|nr:IS630 family transposase [Ktedonobacteraceae bacterium]